MQNLIELQYENIREIAPSFAKKGEGKGVRPQRQKFRALNHGKRTRIRFERKREGEGIQIAFWSSQEEVGTVGILEVIAMPEKLLRGLDQLSSVLFGYF